jgi:type IV pilus assembly protein PilM
MTSAPLTPPLTATAASLKCAECDNDNRPDRQFCGSCGARLWEPCLNCGKPNAAAEKHCGSCGANLAGELRRREASIAAELAKAEALAAESLHAQAIEHLQVLKIADHSGLAKYRQLAAERVTALRTEMLRCNRERDQAIAAGRELLAVCDYEQAAIALESVAEPYRTGELRELLDLVRSRQVDVLTLVADIRRAVADRRTEGLLPKVEELLRLKPDHPQARSLAQRLRPLEFKRKSHDRDALYSAAKAQIDRHEYADALKLLEQIPEDVRTRELQKLIAEIQSKAAEVTWLSRDLREAVAYDEHLLPIAERLAKLRPGDADSAAFIGRVGQASPDKMGSQRKPNSVCQLISPPEKSIWGPPLETISAFNRIDASSLECDDFKYSRDRFCVAAGLALQALGKALININLVPPEKTSLLGLLKTKKKAVASAWGIDVGRAAIKVIRLSASADDERIVAETAQYVEHTTILNAPEADAQAVLCKTLDKLCERIDLTGAPVCMSLPADRVLFRPVALPLVDDKKLAELMKFEVREQIPFPIEHVAWGYQKLAARTSEVAYLNECEVALLAVKIDEVRAAIKPFTDRGLKVDLLTSDAAALLNFITFDRELLALAGRSGLAVARGVHGEGLANSELRTPNSALATAILDVGTVSSNLILFAGSSLVMRAIPLGGNSLSRTMVKEFQLTFAQAEKVKRNPLAVRELHKLYGALEPKFADLAREIRRTIDAFVHAEPQRRISRFVLAGGALKLHAAARYLWHGIP